MAAKNLTPLKPIPTKHIDPDLAKDPKDDNIGLSIKVKWFLRWTQKWSLFPLVTYFPLHGINALILPALEPSSVPNDTLMMIRELTCGIGSSLIWTGISIHVLSGLALRILKKLQSPPKRQKAESFLETQSVAQSKIGLVGGLSGYFIGIKRNLQYNPQELTGWLLTPVLLFHGALMKWLPAAAKVDIDFDFIKWLLNKDRDLFSRVGFGYGPLIALIGLGSYHIIAGSVQYMHVRSLKARKRIMNFILLLICSGMFGLSRLSSEAVFGMDKYYKPILKTLSLS
ncbi:unnamed protein product [Kluyveromyces dobzhanskii CBS 2104]|uniref:WGS project CCBQ000000000 data, contig 00104 n=1 Tax=Kluyveromyces dobzhanskii CBS 2104 TaxID=1427455 RepID=A0A0A8L3Y9_9SACH|nr:unnamed protein product [Kluyveromyces dobzhanskii CBS 2104]